MSGLVPGIRVVIHYPGGSQYDRYGVVGAEDDPVVAEGRKWHEKALQFSTAHWVPVVVELPRPPANLAVELYPASMVKEALT